MIDFDKGLGVTRAVLDAMEVRARVILHNLANQNTPGFKAFRVSFEEELRAAHVAGGDEGAVRPKVVRDRSGPEGQNNVDSSLEMGLLGKVRLLQDLFTRRAGGYFSDLNKAIRGRF